MLFRSGNLSVAGAITGQIRTPDGTVAAPAYSFADDTNTGIARLGGSDTISVVAGGIEQLRFGLNQFRSSRINNSATGGIANTGFFQEFPVRAWFGFRSGVGWAAGNISSYARSSQGVYFFYFAQPMPDPLYSVVTGVGSEGSEPTSRVSSKNYWYFIMWVSDTIDWTGPSGLIDPDYMDFVVLR